MTGDQLEGNGDCVHKAVDCVEPGYTGKADQGSKEGTTRAAEHTYNISQDKQ